MDAYIQKFFLLHTYFASIARDNSISKLTSMYIPPRDYMIHNGSLPIPNRNILIFCNLALLNQNKRFWRLGQIKLTIESSLMSPN